MLTGLVEEEVYGNKEGRELLTAERLDLIPKSTCSGGFPPPLEELCRTLHHVQDCATSKELWFKAHIALSLL